MIPRRIRTGLRSALLLPLAASPLLGAGFENGEVHANSISRIDGTTLSATEVISLSAIAPPQTEPPPPPSFAPAVSTLQGTMSLVNLESRGSISGVFNQLGSTGVSQVDFVDNLIVNPVGVPTGTPLIVEITWNVSGIAEFSGSSRIRNRSKLLLEADGINLDPDPNAPPGPKQQWTRDLTNLIGQDDQLDPFGSVTFEFLVDSGTPDFAGNIRMRSVAGFLVGGPGSVFIGDYSASGRAELAVEFVGVTRVRTTEGATLYKWSTNAQSGLDYGSLDSEPPTTPVLNVAPSPNGPKFSTLFWNSAANEFYFVQASTDGTNWTTVTEVLGTGEPVAVEVINPAPGVAYRLVADIGAGSSPRPPLVAPELCLGRSPANDLRLAWQTTHWQTYSLNEIHPSGTSTTLETVSGDGGAVHFDYPFSGSGRVFQVVSARQ